MSLYDLSPILTFTWYQSFCIVCMSHLPFSVIWWVQIKCLVANNQWHQWNTKTTLEIMYTSRRQCCWFKMSECCKGKKIQHSIVDPCTWRDFGAWFKGAVTPQAAYKLLRDESRMHGDSCHLFMWREQEYSLAPLFVQWCHSAWKVIKASVKSTSDPIQGPNKKNLCLGTQYVCFHNCGDVEQHCNLLRGVSNLIIFHHKELKSIRINSLKLCCLTSEADFSHNWMRKPVLVPHKHTVTPDRVPV